jgi:serine-type D-Ala-D-Ala carboxypeptidase (penicillin-binding protein 5/6)
VIRLKTIKKIIVMFILLVIMVGSLPTVSWAEPAKPTVSAEASILIDMKTGTVLFEKNADKIMEPASITKVMTGLLTIEKLKLDDTVTIRENLNVPGNGMDLKAGETLTIKELLYGMLVHSSNDAAVVLSEQLAPTGEAFNKMADARAAEIGATQTVFKNPNGLNDVTGHVTTARDLALICTEAMRNPVFRKVVSTAEVTIPANNVSPERKYVSTNRLLWDTKTTIVVNGAERTPKYNGAIGIKTGETSTAGLCLVAAAQRNGTELLAVILKAPDSNARFADSITLLDYGFNNYYTYEAIKDGVEVTKAPIAGSSKIKVPAVVPGGYFITLPKEASASLVTSKVQLTAGLKAPLTKGAKVGTVAFYLAGDKVGEVPILTSEAVKVGGPWTAWGISDLIAYILITAISLALLIFVVGSHIRNKRRRALEKRRRAEEIRVSRAERELIENKKKRDWPY